MQCKCTLALQTNWQWVVPDFLVFQEKKNMVFHVDATPKYSLNIFCNGRYTWSLGANISFTTCEEEFIFLTIFEEFIYFKILPSPPGYLTPNR